VQFEKPYTREFFNDFKLHHIHSNAIVLRTRAILIVVYGFFQIALETILLPIHIFLFRQNCPGSEIAAGEQG
jgi:hypothetical protein